MHFYIHGHGRPGPAPGAAAGLAGGPPARAQSLYEELSRQARD